MVRPRVGIVIPALNEVGTIEAVVRQSAKFGTPIVVDDGSCDSTGSVAASIGAVVIKHECNRGYDASLNSGIRRASELGFDVVITIDADGQHDPHSIKYCLELLDQEVDFVVGVRNKCQRPSEYIFAFITRMRYGLLDPLCGLKGYRISFYRELGHIDSYGSIGTELVLFGARNGYAFKQVPLIVRDRNSQPRFGRGFHANYKILRSLIFGLWKY